MRINKQNNQHYSQGTNYYGGEQQQNFNNQGQGNFDQGQNYSKSNRGGYRGGYRGGRGGY